MCSTGVMFAVTIDQRDSRSRPDAVPALLEALAPVSAALSFERTAGDEVQGLLADAAQAVEVLERVLRIGGFSAGVGLGAVELPLPASTREARGAAFIAARAAVEEAKRRASAPVAVRGPDGCAAGEDADALTWTWARLLAGRTQKQWEAVEAVEAARTQKEAAEALGRTPQALSQLVRAAHAEELERAGRAVASVLAQADSEAGAETQAGRGSGPGSAHAKDKEGTR